MQKLGDIVSEHARAHFVGREAEVAALFDILEPGGPLVVHVHGVAGIGKSSLLEAFAARARGRGARVVRIDCRAVAPTAQAFLTELSEALGEPLPTVDDAAQRLASFGEHVVIVLDTYEAYRLLDAWIRQVFVPSLPVNTRIATAGRNPPASPWRTTPGWQGLFRSLLLEPLSEADALGYLSGIGIPAEVARRINRVTRGHPLAMGMAASIALSDADRVTEHTELRQIVDELARSYFEAVPDAITQRALEASSVVRCVTEPLLRALLPGVSPRDTLERLAALPFVELGREGLFIHDAVRSVIASSLAARDPDSHREYRRAAWTYLQERSRSTDAGDSWRQAADLLFLLQNPVLREGFFPSGPRPLAVEPATPADQAAVLRIVRLHAASQLDALAAWCRHQPDALHVVRDEEDGSVCGFYLVTRGSDLATAIDAADPVAAAWRRDAATRDPAATLFCRGCLERDLGEAHSQSQAAVWVDIKRTYIERRKSLRWVYMALMNPAPYGEVTTRLGFRPLPEATVDVGRATLHSFVLDMGPGLVDGWLSNLVGAEIAQEGARPLDLLDIDARELVLPAGRVGLTSLEFGVMRHLQERPGKAIGRYDLMEAVWGYRNPTASNVVDVVVASLRRKLGDESASLETVRGTGYRYRTRGAIAHE